MLQCFLLHKPAPLPPLCCPERALECSHHGCLSRWARCLWASARACSAIRDGRAGGGEAAQAGREVQGGRQGAAGQRDHGLLRCQARSGHRWGAWTLWRVNIRSPASWVLTAPRSARRSSRGLERQWRRCTQAWPARARAQRQPDGVRRRPQPPGVHPRLQVRRPPPLPDDCLLAKAGARRSPLGPQPSSPAP